MSPLTPTEIARDYIETVTQKNGDVDDAQLCRAYETIREASGSVAWYVRGVALISQVQTFIAARPGKFPKTEAALAERSAAGATPTPVTNPATGAGTAYPSSPQALPGSGFVTAGIIVCIASILFSAIFAATVYPASVSSEGSIADMTIQALGDRYITHFNWLMFILFSGIGSTIGTILFVGGSIQKAVYLSANLARRQP